MTFDRLWISELTVPILTLLALTYGLGGLVILAVHLAARRLEGFRLRLDKPVMLPWRKFQHNGEPNYDWDDWHRDAKEAHPIRYFLTESLPLFFRRKIWSHLETAKYWLRTHTYNRYHMLDLRNPFYDWGWVDCDNQILYASFNILKSYVEAEMTTIDWEWDEPHQEVGAEIRALYDWWTVERKAEHDALTNKYDYDAEEAFAEKDQLMLHRLIIVRSYLWS